MKSTWGITLIQKFWKTKLAEYTTCVRQVYYQVLNGLTVHMDNSLFYICAILSIIPLFHFQNAIRCNKKIEMRYSQSWSPILCAECHKRFNSKKKMINEKMYIFNQINKPTYLYFIIFVKRLNLVFNNHTKSEFYSRSNLTWTEFMIVVESRLQLVWIWVIEWTAPLLPLPSSHFKVCWHQQ